MMKSPVLIRSFLFFAISFLALMVSLTYTSHLMKKQEAMHMYYVRAFHLLKHQKKELLDKIYFVKKIYPRYVRQKQQLRELVHNIPKLGARHGVTVDLSAPKENKLHVRVYGSSVEKLHLFWGALFQKIPCMFHSQKIENNKYGIWVEGDLELFHVVDQSLY